MATSRAILAAAFGLVLVCAIASSAYALPAPATGLTPGVSSQRNLSNLDVTSVNATAGYVTQLDINAMSITKSWQGYYGNISGNVILADANNHSLYEWGNASSVSGEVFASRTSDVNWALINCSNASLVSDEETYLGQAAADADSVSHTFNETDHPWFLVGMRNMTGCPSTNAFVNGAWQPEDFHQVLLADDANNTVYTTLIDNDETGYDGTAHDFQLLVGENGHPGSEGTTTYYFFAELS